MLRRMCEHGARVQVRKCIIQFEQRPLEVGVGELVMFLVKCLLPRIGVVARHEELNAPRGADGLGCELGEDEVLRPVVGGNARRPLRIPEAALIVRRAAVAGDVGEPSKFQRIPFVAAVGVLVLGAVRSAFERHSR